MYKNKLDKKIYKLMHKLPKEEIHPSVKVELMDRIEKYGESGLRRDMFINIFYRVSQGVMALSVVVLIALSPTLFNFGGKNKTAEVAVETVPATNLVATNTPKTYFDSIQPDYSAMNYVGY